MPISTVSDELTRHRQAGRLALLAGNLDEALLDLWTASNLEESLLSGQPSAASEMDVAMLDETDLVPLARALTSRGHPRAAEVWCRVLDSHAARSVQVEAAEWLSREAFGHGRARAGLRMLHAANLLGRPNNPDGLRDAYRRAGLDPAVAFEQYLLAARTEAPAARAGALIDPLTGCLWPDQDPRWWHEQPLGGPSGRSGDLHPVADHQAEAFARARDMVASPADCGWLLLAEGDVLAGPTGPRLLARRVGAGHGSEDDRDRFVSIRVAYEGAADRLPGSAWPWYRLAELLAWLGHQERARDYLARADRRPLGLSGDEDHTARERLRDLVTGGLAQRAPENAPLTFRPFPVHLTTPSVGWRRILGLVRRTNSKPGLMFGSILSILLT